MSFLNSIGGAAGAAGGANSAASGLGHMLGADPSRVSDIAGRIGRGMNGIAAAGGAEPGYQAEAPTPPANHIQLLDDAVLQRLVAQFGGQPGYAQ